MIQLHDQDLFRQRCYLAGAWVGAESGATMPVFAPASGARIGAVPALGAAETARAIDAAAAAWPDWRARPAKERAAVLRRWHALMLAHAQDLARIMTTEQGKPVAEAQSEVAYAASFVEWFAEEAKRVYGEVIPGHQRDVRIMVRKEPVGVVAAITPWNFPAAMITRKVAPALAAGCPVVCKPAPETPFTALALAELAARAGFPPGVFSVLTGPAEAIGGEMSANPKVRKLTFTGSTAVGKLLMAQCAGTVKKISLELGGNAPFLVFDDADLDQAVSAAMTSKFRNAGQTCVCANRILVQDAIHDAFAAHMAAAVAALKVGEGFEQGVEIGPLINEAAVAKVERHIADAVEKGARVVVGGGRHARGGTFFQPTLLTGMTGDMVAAREETFGPVAPLYRFRSEEEAIAMANDTEYGLAAYLCARDIGRITRVAEGLEYGIVGINTGLISTEVAPFGGMKESGLGREGSHYGIEEFVEVKYLCLGGL